MGRPAQRTQGSVPENQFRRPRPDLHGGRLTEILEPLPEPRVTSMAPAREEHRVAGSPSNRPRWIIIRQTTPHTRTSGALEHRRNALHTSSTTSTFFQSPPANQTQERQDRMDQCDWNRKLERGTRNRCFAACSLKDGQSTSEECVENTGSSLLSSSNHHPRAKQECQDQNRSH